MSSLYCSTITYSNHVPNIQLKLWERIISAGGMQNPLFSTMEWPNYNDTSLAPVPLQWDLLFTGH